MMNTCILFESTFLDRLQHLTRKYAKIYCIHFLKGERWQCGGISNLFFLVITTSHKNINNRESKKYLHQSQCSTIYAAIYVTV